MLYTAVKQGNLEGVTQIRLVRTVTTPDGGKEKIIAVTGDLGGVKIDPIRLRQGETLDLSQLSIKPAGKDSSLIIGPDVPVKSIKTETGETILTPAGIHAYRSKEVYAVMIKKLLPVGVLGLLAAALMAALMGNLSSASNSIATMVSYDIVKRFRPATGDRQLVLIGRVATLSSIALGIALVPLLDRKASIFNALNEIIAHMAPPITCVFLLGVFWPAASARGAKWTMWLGSVLGVSIYALKALHEGHPETFAWVPAFFITTPFMMMAFYMFVACLILQILFTKIQPKLAGEDLQALYWPHPLDALKAPGWSGILNYKILAGIVIVAMGILYLIFH
jgi:Sodium:solute symporter family